METQKIVRIKSKVKDLFPGILLCAAIAAPAWALGKKIPVVGGPVFSIAMGIFIATALFPRIDHSAVNAGRQYTGKKILQYAIVLLGFGMNFVAVLRVGGQSFLIMSFTFAAAFLTAWIAGKLLKLPGETTTLIGVGTSICGGSAIAAAAPVIGAKDEEVARAISTIFLFNVIAVFIFPVIGRALGMTDTGFGLWAGTAVNDTSSVVATGVAWSSFAGNNVALDYATIVKLSRTLMIVTVTLVLAIVTARKAQRDARKNAQEVADSAANGATAEAKTEGAARFSFIKVFPWFVVGFLAAALINTFTGLPAEAADFLGEVGKFMIVMAMAAIGLGTDLKKLFGNGVRPIVLGLCCWFAVAAVSIAVQTATGGM
jgi:uncharacterized integral membrane protein (TIGR00698 family)